MMVTLHHGSWTLYSTCMIYIFSETQLVTKLDSGKNFDERVSVLIQDDNHRIAVTNNGPASLHCALYQLMKITRGD